MDSNLAAVNLKVNPVDDDPVAVNDGKTVAEDGPATTIDVLANDTDIEAAQRRLPR